MISETLAKLRAMPAREISHRLRYAAYLSLERQLHRRGVLARPGRLRAGLVPEMAGHGAWHQALLERRANSRFFPWQDDAASVRDAFHSDYRLELEKARKIAEEAARHEISFFGETLRLGAEINWHADPVTGAEWPRVYHQDLDCRRSAGCGDIKHVWELNRHQFLMDLAKVALVDGSRRHAEETIALVDSWREAAPYGTGAPWACALEPAFRAWSWLWAYHMILSAGLIPADAHLRWLEGFLDHGTFLHRHLEHFKSPYNHLVGEASALFALGLSFPEFRESQAWVRRGRDVLEGTLGTQFYADGGSVEQSTFYHHATLGFYMLAGVLGRRHGQELNADTWSAVERGVEFSVALVQPDGRLPSIGGADDGKPIRLEHLPFWDFRPYYAIGAVLFRRGDFKSAAARFWEDAFWVLGPAARQEFSAVPVQPATVTVILPQSGYAVLRTSRAEDADYLLFDCGPQAAGLRRDGVPSAAHGHADCLSLIATLAGKRVLVDPGFYCYNGEPEWEVHFRKTGAHNTVTIDGRDQARHISKMAWTHTYEAQLEATSAAARAGWARGSHDGFARNGDGVRHRRSAWLRDGGYIVILDELSGGTGGTARATFQFAPGRLEHDRPDRVLFENRFDFAWAATAPVAATLVQGGEKPSDGWIAPSLGVRVQAPRLLLECPLNSSPVLLLTVLADRLRMGERSLPRVSFEAVEPGAGGPALAATIEGPGWRDRLIAAVGNVTVEHRGIVTDASLAVVRFGPRGAEDVQRLGGGFVRVQEEGAPPAGREDVCMTGLVERR